jgi:hypothetical protein
MQIIKNGVQVTKEAHFVFYGAAGNGKTSLVRGVANHIKGKSRDVEIISASTASIQKDDTKMSLMSAIEPAEKLKTLFQIARQRASGNKYVILNIEEMDLIVGAPKMTTVLLQELSPTDKTANSNIILVGTTNKPDLIKNMRDQEWQQKQQDATIADLSKKFGLSSNPATSQGAAQSIARRLKLVKIDTPDQNTVKALLNQHINRTFNNKSDAINELSKKLCGLSADTVVKFALQVESNAKLNTQQEILQKAERYLQDNDKQTPINHQRQAVVSKIIGIYQNAQEHWKIGQSDTLKINELEDHLKDKSALSDLLQSYSSELEDCNTKIKALNTQSESAALDIEALEGYGTTAWGSEEYNGSKHFGIAGLNAKLRDARSNQKQRSEIDKIKTDLARHKAELKIKQKDKQKIDDKLQKLETATNAIDLIKDELINYQGLLQASTQLNSVSASTSRKQDSKTGGRINNRKLSN